MKVLALYVKVNGSLMRCIPVPLFYRDFDNMLLVGEEEKINVNIIMNYENDI
ncbi:hypothetical protein [Clostridium sp.]|uniref:hypothetical protein n=1 Tax=Clostridium sp. TaxID=1506 RepID=UPI003D6D7A3A